MGASQTEILKPLEGVTSPWHIVELDIAGHNDVFGCENIKQA